LVEVSRRFPIWLHGVWPGLYRALAGRFG